LSSEHQTDQAPEPTQASKRQRRSEHDKRQSHIISEKRRRDLIKQKFDQIYEMIPNNSENKSQSRADILGSAQQFIAALESSNEKL
ncbi:hypothetical protein CANCADRAFT_11880, partial [Tortispora caseinolytica NRRL Y-17796]